MLTTNEKKILEVLKELKKAKIEILEDKTGLPRSTLMSAIESLKTKKAVTVHTKKIEFIEPTDEGSKRAIQGLPERIIVNKVFEIGGKAKLKDLKNLTGLSEQEISIGLGWIRRKKWGRIESKYIKTYTVTAEGVKKEIIVKEAELIVDKIPLKSIVEHVLEKTSKTGYLRLDSLPMVEQKAALELISRNLLRKKSLEEVEVEIKPEGLKLLAEEREYISAITHDIIKRREWLVKEIKPYDIKALPPKVYPGKKHFYLEFIDMIKEILVSMGFEEAEGPIVEVELWNFDVLFQPQDHPAREIHDTFRLKFPNRVDIDDTIALRVKEVHERGGKSGSRGWRYSWRKDIAERLILRTQTTSVSVRFLAERKDPPIKMFTIGKVYRPDTIDAKHLPEFHQLDGIVMDRNLNFRNLLGILEEFFKQLGIDRVKFRPSYFPFTEPSVEGYIWHPKVGWVETFGAGMFRPEVLDVLDVKYPTAAWGIGVDRVAMIIMGINDIRNLYSQSISYLREAKVLWRF